MVAQPGDLKSSCNAGEFSEDLYGRVDIKQYYAAAKRMRNVEPVPQSGFRLMPGSALVGAGRSRKVAQGTLKVSPNLSYTLFVSAGWADIYRNDRMKVASVKLPDITAEMIAELRFYGEANTFGIFHQDLRSKRLFRNAYDDTSWIVSDWPYDKLPEVDLGGNYEKTIDEWELGVRWSDTANDIVLQISVDGEITKSIELNADPGGNPNWSVFAAQMQTELRLLPSLGDGVTFKASGGSSGYKRFQVKFGGDLAGVEYQVNAQIVNTADASVLTYHLEVGETKGEPLVSSSRGWFAGMDLYQDRAIYIAPKAKAAAIAWSQTGEYFDLNIKSQSPSAARLEALRTKTSERVWQIYEGEYLLAFTDQAEWFVSNRTIKRDEAVNWVRASNNGVTPNVPVAEMEGRIYYVSGGNDEDPEQENLEQGQTLYSAGYDDVSTKYNSDPESLLASHLVDGICGSALQKKVRKNNAARWWLHDKQGRLVCALVIRNQDIMAMCQWEVAERGQVVGLSVDGQNQVWVTVDRGGTVTHEVFEEMERNLLQGAVRGSTNNLGVFSGLNVWEGKQVWARADGFILGPFTVDGGKIDLGDVYQQVVAGLWQAPMFESLPSVKVLPGDQILRRPGRIHTVNVSVIKTESVAVGANKSAAKNQSLLLASDPADQPMPPKTKQVVVAGMMGAVVDTTLVITQLRPGMLRVRDYVTEAAL
ncbi:hypothetical protein [Pseudovibrio sp. POLY-S9]|uniref:hypothetical protein n=1 Tax=Pseudovibrio sp. POLY-S9 TaxID=1576596 RepID=UPI00070F5C30|nr:hypothetical protein [Pseudovibrio sp. POLY-S9]